MNAKTTIRKFLFVSLWLTIGGGMLTLLIAAIGKKHRELCRDYRITIKGAESNFFVDEKDIQQLLISQTGGPVKGQPISSFKLHRLEQILEDNAWIKDAELYFNNRDVLQVTITEGEPIARIFTTGGSSFYIDSMGRKMPLSEKLSARVPVFTGFPEKNVLSKKDSLLLHDVKTTATFIFNDPFWMAQVAQIDITPERTFEMIPVIGNHIVRLGNGEDIDQKFHRLFVFYQQVSSKTGFDKYKVLDVQFTGQVVASMQAGITKVDSVQLKKNVEKLLWQAQQSGIDVIATTHPLAEKPAIIVDSTAVRMNSFGASTTTPTTTTTTDLNVRAGKSTNTSTLPVRSAKSRSTPLEQAGNTKPRAAGPSLSLPSRTAGRIIKSDLISKPYKPIDLKGTVIRHKVKTFPKWEDDKKIPKAVMAKKVVVNGEK